MAAKGGVTRRHTLLLCFLLLDIADSPIFVALLPANVCCLFVRLFVCFACLFVCLLYFSCVGMCLPCPPTRPPALPPAAHYHRPLRKKQTEFASIGLADMFNSGGAIVTESLLPRASAPPSEGVMGGPVEVAAVELMVSLDAPGSRPDRGTITLTCQGRPSAECTSYRNVCDDPTKSALWKTHELRSHEEEGTLCTGNADRGVWCHSLFWSIG